MSGHLHWHHKALLVFSRPGWQLCLLHLHKLMTPLSQHTVSSYFTYCLLGHQMKFFTTKAGVLSSLLKTFSVSVGHHPFSHLGQYLMNHLWYSSLSKYSYVLNSIFLDVSCKCPNYNFLSTHKALVQPDTFLTSAAFFFFFGELEIWSILFHIPSEDCYKEYFPISMWQHVSFHWNTSWIASCFHNSCLSWPLPILIISCIQQDADPFFGRAVAPALTGNTLVLQGNSFVPSSV